jgi:long-chain acyl-CoA synthetase
VPFNARARVDETSGALSVAIRMINTVARVVDGEAEALRDRAHAARGELFTGDVGFRNSERWFFVVDPKKGQINASGYNVRPRDVEHLLYERSALRGAAVVCGR